MAGLVGGNAYYSKFVFANLPRPLRRAELLDGQHRVEMSRVADTAQWSAQHGQLSGAVSFALTTADGGRLALAGCFPSRPGRPGTACPAAPVVPASGPSAPHLRGSGASADTAVPQAGSGAMP